MAKSLPGLEALADQLRRRTRAAADLQDVVGRPDVHEVDRPSDPRRNRLRPHGTSLPDVDAGRHRRRRHPRDGLGWAP